MARMIDNTPRTGNPATMKQRILNLLIAIDQLAWVVVTLGRGKPDETISAALWRMEQESKLAGRLLRPLIDVLFRPLEHEHCRKVLSLNDAVRICPTTTGRKDDRWMTASF